MKNIFKSIIICILLASLASCYALEDDGAMSVTSYQVVVSNGLPHYRDGRVDYYYYNSYYYYPYYLDGERYWRRYTRPLPPPRRMRPPQRGFDRRPPKPQRFDRNHGRPIRNRSFGNGTRR